MRGGAAVIARVAALYDVHGNLPALEAVLAEVDEAQVEVVVVGGDIVWGPMPRECLDLLVQLGERAAFVRGNADREVADRDVTAADALVAEVTLWCADQLTGRQRSFLAELPTSVSIDVDGVGSTLFCHGSPRADDESMTAATADEKVLDIVAGCSEDVVVCGHTHAQFDRRVGRRRVVNAGSVGLPFGDARGAYWALLGPDVKLRRTSYDAVAAAARVRGSLCPDADGFAEHILHPPPAARAADIFTE
jgi:putative phosphoesterase